MLAPRAGRGPRPITPFRDSEVRDRLSNCHPFGRSRLVQCSFEGIVRKAGQSQMLGEEPRRQVLRSRCFRIPMPPPAPPAPAPPARPPISPFMPAAPPPPTAAGTEYVVKPRISLKPAFTLKRTYRRSADTAGVTSSITPLGSGDAAAANPTACPRADESNGSASGTSSPNPATVSQHRVTFMLPCLSTEFLPPPGRPGRPSGYTLLIMLLAPGNDHREIPRACPRAIPLLRGTFCTSLTMCALQCKVASMHSLYGAKCGIVLWDVEFDAMPRHQRGQASYEETLDSQGNADGTRAVAGCSAGTGPPELCIADQSVLSQGSARELWQACPHAHRWH